MTAFFLDKQPYKLRWPVLSFTVWITMGAYFCYDQPSSLRNSLREHFGEMDADVFDIYYAGLFSIYSFANIFLPFISGGIRDVIGDRFVLTGLGILIIIGQTIFTYGIIQRSFFIMYFGRVVLGWGIESILPTQTSFIQPYYRDDYLAFSVGMNELFATLGTVFCFWFMPSIAESSGIVVAVSLGILFNIVSFGFSIVATTMDGKAEKQLTEQAYAPVQGNEEAVQEQQQEEEKKEDQQEVPQQEVVAAPVRSEVVSQGFLGAILNFQEVKSYPRLFWYMSIYYALVFTSMLALMQITVALFTEKWLVDVENAELIASRMIALMWLLTGILTPVFGLLIDHFGHRSSISILSAFMCIIAQLLVLLYQPFVGLIILGFSQALSFATIWTGIVYVVRQDNYGKAYAIVVCMYNLGLTIVPLVIALLRSYTGTYILSQVFLVVLGGFAVVFAILIYREDHKVGALIDRGIFVEYDARYENSSMIEARKQHGKM